MIRANYDRSNIVMSIKGHAQTAPKGEDLVCAGASTLAFTAVAALEDHAGKYFPSISRRDGELRITCRPSRRNAAACRRVLDTIFTGFEILANQYPGNVIALKEENDG